MRFIHIQGQKIVLIPTEQLVPKYDFPRLAHIKAKAKERNFHSVSFDWLPAIFGHGANYCIIDDEAETVFMRKKTGRGSEPCNMAASTTFGFDDIWAFAVGKNGKDDSDEGPVPSPIAGDPPPDLVEVAKMDSDDDRCQPA